MLGAPQVILKYLISSVVSLAQLVSSSVALPAELVSWFVHNLYFFLFLQRGGGKFHNSKPSSLTTSMAILGNYIETYEKEK